MRGSMAKGLLAIVVFSSTASCVTNGEDFPSDTSWIKEGVTKKSDVKQILGEPYAVGNVGGRPAWTYGYYYYKIVGKSTQKELKFYWKENDTVDSYSFNSSFPDDISKQPGAKAPKAALPSKTDEF